MRTYAYVNVRTETKNVSTILSKGNYYDDNDNDDDDDITEKRLITLIILADCSSKTDSPRLFASATITDTPRSSNASGAIKATDEARGKMCMSEPTTCEELRHFTRGSILKLSHTRTNNENKLVLIFIYSPLTVTPHSTQPSTHTWQSGRFPCRSS